MEYQDLLRQRDAINELLARYGVKFGIYKNNTFYEQLFTAALLIERLKELEEKGKDYCHSMWKPLINEYP